MLFVEKSRVQTFWNLRGILVPYDPLQRVLTFLERGHNFCEMKITWSRISGPPQNFCMMRSHFPEFLEFTVIRCL
jgi:hypothetical protein